MHEVIVNRAAQAAHRCVNGCDTIVSRAGGRCRSCARDDRRENSDASRERNLRVQGMTRQQAHDEIRSAP